MKKILIYLLANGLALYLISLILEPNFLVTGGVKGYLIAGVIIGLVNSIVKPILKILSFPLMLMSLGLFSIVLNIILLILAKYLIGVLAFEGVALQITGMLNYLWAALLISVANLIIHWIPSK